MRIQQSSLWKYILLKIKSFTSEPMYLVEYMFQSVWIDVYIAMETW